MSFSLLSFSSPLLLSGLLALPIIWWLLRLTPPRPKEEVFPPTQILAEIEKPEETPAQSPWWLTLLRLRLRFCSPQHRAHRQLSRDNYLRCRLT